MATCPECGGRLFPLRPGSLILPREAVRCRWCRALLAVPAWLRAAILSGLLLFSFGVALVRPSGAGGEAAPRLLIAAAIATAAAVLAWLIGSCAPLRTLRPRDHRDWHAAAEPGGNGAGREVS